MTAVASSDNINIYIKRVPKGKDHPYFALARDAAQNRALSFEARGMLAYLLSKPDDWKLNPKDLEQQCSRSRVFAILKELRHAGYVIYNKIREKGRIKEHRYEVYEQPYLDFSDMENSTSGENHIWKTPHLENQHAYIIENKESQNTDSTKQESPPNPHEGTDTQPPEPAESKAALTHGGEGEGKAVKAEKPEKTPDYLKNPHLYAQTPVSDDAFEAMPKTQRTTAMMSAICWHVEKSAQSPEDVYQIVTDRKSGMERALLHHLRQVKGATPSKLADFIRQYRKDEYGSKAKNPALIASRFRASLLPSELDATPLPRHDPNCPHCKGKGYVKINPDNPLSDMKPCACRVQQNGGAK